MRPCGLARSTSSTRSSLLHRPSRVFAGATERGVGRLLTFLLPAEQQQQLAAGDVSTVTVKEGGGISALLCAGGTLWVGTPQGLVLLLDTGPPDFRQVSTGPLELRHSYWLTLTGSCAASVPRRPAQGRGDFLGTVRRLRHVLGERQASVSRRLAAAAASAPCGPLRCPHRDRPLVCWDIRETQPVFVIPGTYVFGGPGGGPAAAARPVSAAAAAVPTGWPVRQVVSNGWACWAATSEGIKVFSVDGVLKGQQQQQAAAAPSLPQQQSQKQLEQVSAALTREKSRAMELERRLAEAAAGQT